MCKITTTFRFLKKNYSLFKTFDKQLFHNLNERGHDDRVASFSQELQKKCCFGGTLVQHGAQPPWDAQVSRQSAENSKGEFKMLADQMNIVEKFGKVVPNLPHFLNETVNNSKL